MSDESRDELLFGWGGAVASSAKVYRPADVDALRSILASLPPSTSVAVRGTGCSYGDASLNGGGVILDLTRLNRVRAFDPKTGIVHVDAGVTVRDLWRLAVPRGWWPPVVSGTAAPTIGGILGANIHGKNAFHAGTISNHVLRFGALLADGSRIEVDRERDPELFGAFLGSFGLLGVITDAVIRLKPVPGGRMRVSVLAPRSLGAMIADFEREKDRSDYLVGWIDGFAGGTELGRGVIHKAVYAGPDEDREATATLALDRQDLPSTLFGVVPKSVMWAFLRPFLNDLGMSMINRAKDIAARREAAVGKTYLQSHAAFAFLLDYVPGWKRAYGAGGLIQYQSFVPVAAAERVHSRMIAEARARGLTPYLLVYKRHLPERGLMTHAVDGFSMAMDFRVTASRRGPLWDLCREYDAWVAEAGGRIYFAKDATSTPENVRRMFGSEVDALAAIKKRLDPHGRWRSDLARRLALG